MPIFLTGRIFGFATFATRSARPRLIEQGQTSASFPCMMASVALFSGASIAALQLVRALS